MNKYICHPRHHFFQRPGVFQKENKNSQKQYSKGTNTGSSPVLIPSYTPLSSKKPQIQQKYIYPSTHTVWCASTKQSIEKPQIQKKVKAHRRQHSQMRQ